jgi:acyl-CoA thioester hydrolase
VDGYPFVYRDTVRFRDLDGMGHVNNAVFLTYMESARIAYLTALGAGDDPLRNLILARAEVDFRSPITFGEEIEVGVRSSRLGTKSFELVYELRADGRVAAEGKSVLVGYDYEKGESVEIPEEWRAWLAPKAPDASAATEAMRAVPARPVTKAPDSSGPTEAMPAVPAWPVT